MREPGQRNGERIGELLLARGWIEPRALERALARQRATGQRLCSLLIGHGVLAADDAARALGDQLGVAAVLQKHLAHRELALAARLPAEIARGCLALPLGRMRSGELIVCVRDPAPALQARLAQVLGEPVVLAVAPASALELLIAEVYGVADEIDIDLTTGPIAVLADLTLVELDAQGVSKDPSEGPQIQIGRQTRDLLPPAKRTDR